MFTFQQAVLLYLHCFILNNMFKQENFLNLVPCFGSAAFVDLTLLYDVLIPDGQLTVSASYSFLFAKQKYQNPKDHC